MLRRVISAIVLTSLAAAPVVARARFVCRYTGIEITDCAEQKPPAYPEAQKDGCCDQQLTPARSVMLTASNENVQPPVTAVLPARLVLDNASAPAFQRRVELARPSPGQPVYLITRALLI